MNDRWRHNSTVFGVAAVMAVAATLMLSLANVWLGSLNQDEGWYLLAARMVRDGAMPYRDFAFTQGPVMPLIYAPLMGLVDRGGLLAARLLTAAFGLLTVWTVALMAGRLVAREDRLAAVCLTVMLAGINVYHAYFTAIVKTYAVAGFLLSAGFFLLFVHRGRPSRPALVGAAAAFVLAAATRVSLVVVGPAMVLGLWWARRQWPRAWLWFAAGGLVAGLAVFLPFALAAFENLWFGMVEYHAGRSPGGWMAALTLKAGFVSRAAQAYFVPLAVGVMLAGHRLCLTGEGTREPAPGNVPPVLSRAAAASLLLVTLIHFASPFPYDDYQTVIYAPACALLAAFLVRYLRRWSHEPAVSLRWAALGLLAVSVMASMASPINQDWFVIGRDRIWWRFKPQSDLQTLRETAHRIRGLQEHAGGELLTQDAYLAIEAGASVPAELALGPFCYFPDMPTDRARRLHVLNRERMETLLRNSPARVAAFSGYGLAIASPDITPIPRAEQAAFWVILNERFDVYEQVEDFGQAHTTLTILQRRPDGDDES